MKYAVGRMTKTMLKSIHRFFLSKSCNVSYHIHKSLQWIKKNSILEQGIKIHHKSTIAYPEVTGYFIPTLLFWGEHKRAKEYAQWLLTVQNKDGSWPSPDGIAYTFDSGQILKGLWLILSRMPEVETAFRQGCDWLSCQILDNGRIVTPSQESWRLPNGSILPESVHLYTLEPLRHAAKIFHEPKYEEAVERALEHYLAQPELTDFRTLSHFHAYILEALVDLGRPERAEIEMNNVERRQRKNGRIPAYPDKRFACSTAMAQYAVIWYKLGKREPANKAFDALCKMQNSSGGFYGSYGWASNYFPKREISWAVKYFLDAAYWKIKTEFDETVSIFPETIDPEDGRFALIEQVCREERPTTVLDAGCGKGRFITLLKQRYPHIVPAGLDLSDAMLACLPPEIEKKCGTIMNIPCADASYDLVFCVEALEHAINVPQAVKELTRVVASQGTLVIIDKNIERLGALQISAWEQWFHKEEIVTLLENEGMRVSLREALPYNGKDGSDNLFLAWIATKP